MESVLVNNSGSEHTISKPNITYAANQILGCTREKQTFFITVPSEKSVMKQSPAIYNRNIKQLTLVHENCIIQTFQTFAAYSEQGHTHIVRTLQMKSWLTEAC
jgi:hypothetical protein